MYILKDGQDRAVVFSKAMIKEYKKYHPNVVVYPADSIEFAQSAIGLTSEDEVYAIKRGVVVGVFTSHDDFKQFAIGFSKPDAKKCSIGKAFEYLGKMPKKPKKTKSKRKSLKKAVDNSQPITEDFDIALKKAMADCFGKMSKQLYIDSNASAGVYTDGSCKDNLMGVGYSLHIGANVLTHTTYIESDTATSQKAELIAVMLATDRAIAEGVKQLTIYYDCVAVVDILRGACKSQSQQDFFSYYFDYMRDRMQKIEIVFEKVKSHSGNAHHNYIDKAIHHSQIAEILEML